MIITVGRQGSLVIIVGLEAIVSIILGILLIPSMGMLGIVSGGLVGAVVTGGWFVLWFPARISNDSLFQLFRYAFLPGLAALIPAILWQVLLIATSAHNFDFGSLLINGSVNGILLLAGVGFLGFDRRERQKMIRISKNAILRFMRAPQVPMERS
jgi:O-antigen/teichoic acid export membrane protein